MVIRVVIPIGDPAGIGPEVTLKALAQLQESTQITRPNRQTDHQISLVGSRSVLAPIAQSLNIDLDRLPLIDIPLQTPIAIGQGNAASGAASFAYLSTAIDQTLAGKFDAIVTAPTAKSAWAQAGHRFPGQTELLAQKAAEIHPDTHSAMAFVARSPHSDWILRMALATTHIPLRAVPDLLASAEGLALLDRKLDLFLDWLHQDFGLSAPHIAIPGLNPHSGEQGQLGREELDWLIPWLDRARARHPQAQLDGLIPPDTLWINPGRLWFGSGSSFGPSYDGIFSLYHDQGLIPVKLLAFDRAVNTTIGLPFVRTSPDHGTAFDIAGHRLTGQGIAQPDSMIAAIEWGIELALKRSANIMTNKQNH
jgi:4-hydroxythreonine-4-phosphate dehydrogenase